MGKGDYFGEEDILTQKEHRSFKAIVSSPNATLYSIKREKMVRLFEKLENTGMLESFMRRLELKEDWRSRKLKRFLENKKNPLLPTQALGKPICQEDKEEARLKVRPQKKIDEIRKITESNSSKNIIFRRNFNSKEIDMFVVSREHEQTVYNVTKTHKVFAKESRLKARKYEHMKTALFSVQEPTVGSFNQIKSQIKKDESEESNEDFNGRSYIVNPSVKPKKLKATRSNMRQKDLETSQSLKSFQSRAFNKLRSTSKRHKAELEATSESFPANFVLGTQDKLAKMKKTECFLKQNETKSKESPSMKKTQEENGARIKIVQNQEKNRRESPPGKFVSASRFNDSKWNSAEKHLTLAGNENKNRGKGPNDLDSFVRINSWQSMDCLHNDSQTILYSPKNYQHAQKSLDSKSKGGFVLCFPLASSSKDLVSPFKRDQDQVTPQPKLIHFKRKQNDFESPKFQSKEKIFLKIKRALMTQKTKSQSGAENQSSLTRLDSNKKEESQTVWNREVIEKQEPIQRANPKMQEIIQGIEKSNKALKNMSNFPLFSLE